MRRSSLILGEETLSYSRVIRFPDPPKAIAIGFVGDPPIPAVDVAERAVPGFVVGAPVNEPVVGTVGR